ncbi:hypothetical protein VTN02DRAFT_3269 [Thermoascus thermophilus]
MASNREFDLVLLGPTGYTGRLCAEHIVQHLPTDLKWAIAGRSAEKLEQVAKDLKDANPDRIQPEILVLQLDKQELDPLARKTRLIINCVGPYHLYSTPVVEACANNGTHYVDATGETPWVKRIIEKYHEAAKSNGAIIIPSVGIESALPDMLTWSLVKLIHEKLSVSTKEVISSIHEIKSSGPSGGTLSTILTTLDTVGLQDLLKATDPFALAASPPPTPIPRRSIVETIFGTILGVRSVPDLGTLTTSPSAVADVAIVHRSSTLMRELYGPRFYFQQFLRARNVFVAFFIHVALVIGLAFLVIPQVRWLVQRFVYPPGEGPKRDPSDRIEFRAVATADQEAVKPKRALGRLTFQGGLYPLTGLLLAEAAMVILTDEEKVKEVSRCGIVTPATLGEEYVDRLGRVGCRIETQLLDY